MWFVSLSAIGDGTVASNGGGGYVDSLECRGKSVFVAESPNLLGFQWQLDCLFDLKVSGAHLPSKLFPSATPISHPYISKI